MSELRCPIGRCAGRRGPEQLTCARHWFQLPRPVRDEIWHLYRTAKGSDAQRSVALSAIAWLDAKERRVP